MKPVCPAMIALLAACGANEPPQVTAQSVAPSPVVRGEPAEGSFIVSDSDGLDGVEVDALLWPSMREPELLFHGSLGEGPDARKMLFGFRIAVGAPVGDYRISAAATDAEGAESAEAAVFFSVE